MPSLAEYAFLAECFILGAGVGIKANELTTPPSSPTVLQYPENIPWQRLDPDDPVTKVWQNLQKPTITGLDGQGRSYEEIMVATGYQVFEPSGTGSLPLTGVANLEKGLNVRARPTTNGVISPILRHIKGGESVFWRGEFLSKNPDGSIHVFGLLIDPNHKEQSLVNPVFIAIRTHNSDGTINWHVNMASTYVKQLADGAIDFGNGIIGPSTADTRLQTGNNLE